MKLLNYLDVKECTQFARVVKAVADAREENGGEAPVEAPAEEKVEEAAE